MSIFEMDFDKIVKAIKNFLNSILQPLIDMFEAANDAMPESDDNGNG